MAGLRQALADPAAAWKGMSQGQRVGAMAALALFISAAIVSVMWANSPAFQPLYSGLSLRSGGEVIAALGKLNVPYRVSGGGSIIEVPAGRVDSLRLKLAAEGLPSTGEISFASLSKQPLGTSQFVQRVQYQRALAGALARTIDSLSAVHSAQVNLAIPPPPVFMDDNRKPTASVLLVLNPGETLSAMQVMGIEHLVAAAVTGLDDRNVSIIDQNGNLLSGAGLEGAVAGPAQLSYQNKVEQGLEMQIVGLLSPIVGVGHVKVSVAADIAFSKGRTASVTYGKGHVLSKQARLSKNGLSTRAVGIPGALSNTPPGAAAAPLVQAPSSQTGSGISRSGSQQSSSTVNYQNDRVVKDLTITPGVVKRLSIAVLLDYRSVKGAKGKTKSMPLPAAEITRITTLVKNAVGFNAARGDGISVVSMPFASKQAPVAVPPLPWWHSPLVPVALRYLVAVLGFLLLWFLLIRPILKAALKRIEAHAAGARAVPEEAAMAQAEAQRIATSEAGLSRQIHAAREVIDKDPSGAAEVMREWLSK